MSLTRPLKYLVASKTYFYDMTHDFLEKLTQFAPDASGGLVRFLRSFIDFLPCFTG